VGEGVDRVLDTVERLVFDGIRYDYAELAAQARQVIGQAGSVTTDQRVGEWHSIRFDVPIVDAVVVMGPVSFNGHHAATTRVRNVTDDGFEFRIEEWNYLDGGHITETIGWLALSEGIHVLESGQTVVAGTQQMGVDFERIEFGTTLDDAIVLSEVTTFNGPDAVTTRTRDVDATGARLRMQEEEAQGWHLDETVSWIAIETGTGTGMQALRTGTEVDDSPDHFDFAPGVFDAAPVFLADMQTFRGPDTAALRVTALDASGASIFVEEEQSRDAERTHVDEQAGLLALEAGLLYA
jgi:hypothetical protein